MALLSHIVSVLGTTGGRRGAAPRGCCYNGCVMRVRAGRVWTVPAAAVEGLEGGDAGLVRVRIDGLLCSACATRTEGFLARVPGVDWARVDLDAGRAVVRRAEGVGDEELEAAVRRAALFMPLRRLLARLGAWGPPGRIRDGKGCV
jgi:copper chaperone CopZ